MRKRRWMGYMEDYNFSLHYHLVKENVVADALSRKSRGVLASVVSREWQMLKTVGQFKLQYMIRLGQVGVWNQQNLYPRIPTTDVAKATTI